MIILRCTAGLRDYEFYKLRAKILAQKADGLILLPWIVEPVAITDKDEFIKVLAQAPDEEWEKFIETLNEGIPQGAEPAGGAAAADSGD